MGEAPDVSPTLREWDFYRGDYYYHFLDFNTEVKGEIICWDEFYFRQGREPIALLPAGGGREVGG